MSWDQRCHRRVRILRHGARDVSLRRFARLVAIGIILGLFMLALVVTTSSEHAEVGPSVAHSDLGSPLPGGSSDVAARDAGPRDASMPVDAHSSPCSRLARAICEARSLHACPGEASCADRLIASCDAWLARTRALEPGFWVDSSDAAACVAELTRRAQAGEQMHAACEHLEPTDPPRATAPIGSSCDSLWDCAVGARCLAGRCVLGERRCTFDAECGRERRCAGASTAACHTFVPDPCVYQDECAPGLVCLEGHCARVPDSLGTAREGDACDCCMGDATRCADGLTCALGVSDGVCRVPLCAEDDPFSEAYEAL